MAEKTWRELTGTEKIEDLRKDVVRLFNFMSQFREAIEKDLRQLRTKIEALEKRE